MHASGVLVDLILGTHIQVSGIRSDNPTCVACMHAFLKVHVLV